MASWSSLAMLLLLGAILFVALYSLLQLWMDNRHLQNRLRYKNHSGIRYRLTEAFKGNERLYRHLSELLEALQLGMKPVALAFSSVLMLLVGLAVGGLFFQSAKGTVLFGLLLGLLPYTVLRAMLANLRMKTQIDFLPAVELFYQCYLVTGERQVRIALQRAIEERRLLGPMQAVFEQLYRNLSVRGDDEASLRLLSASLGHIWADYFANILRVAITEGVTITESLKELITDMRKARRANEQERNRLLEIRIANFSPLLFLALFIGINIRYNRDNSYYYYMIDPGGRDMLLNAMVLIFASFLMGLWLSRKKM